MKQKSFYYVFIFTALAWGVVGLLLARRISPDAQVVDGVNTLFWFLEIYALCVLNLFCLMKSVANLQKIVSQTRGNQKTKALVGLFFWGTLKVLCLGFIGYILWRGNPELAKAVARKTALLAVSTMVVVPLVGGLWWSKLSTAGKEPG